VIYCAFAFWLFAIVFAARGALKLAGGMVGARVVDWIVLPGTLVAELTRYLACLLTGAEFHAGKLVGEKQTAQTRGGGVPYLTALLTGLLPLAACMGLILLLSMGLDHPVFRSYYFARVEAPKDLPLKFDTIWALLASQVQLMRGVCKALGNTLDNWPWKNWQGWLFQYLMICLTLRMAPNNRPLRPALAGVAIVAGLTAAVVAALSEEAVWLENLWPLLSYTWATALLLLAMALAARGLLALIAVLAGKE